MGAIWRTTLFLCVLFGVSILFLFFVDCVIVRVFRCEETFFLCILSLQFGVM